MNSRTQKLYRLLIIESRFRWQIIGTMLQRYKFEEDYGERFKIVISTEEREIIFTFSYSTKKQLRKCMLNI